MDVAGRKEALVGGSALNKLLDITGMNISNYFNHYRTREQRL